MQGCPSSRWGGGGNAGVSLTQVKGGGGRGGGVKLGKGGVGPGHVAGVRCVCTVPGCKRGGGEYRVMLQGQGVCAPPPPAPLHTHRPCSCPACPC